MNIVISYEKEGATIIPVTITVHNNTGILFSKEFQFDKNKGTVEFDYTRPIHTICNLDLTVTDARVIPDYIIITGFQFDNFWNLNKMCMFGKNIINNQITIENGNSIFFIGTLRYSLLPGSLSNSFFYI